MDLSTGFFLEEYKKNLSSYKKVQNLVDEYLNKFVKDLGIMVNSVGTRLKTEKSLEGKLKLKGYKYFSLFDITDIVGGRIVTFYSDEIDKFAAEVEKTFEVDWENSIDKRKIYDVDRFGYMSLHFICRIPKSLYYDEEDPNINVIPFEIQIRTVLQHAWATIYHDTGYKNDIEVPKEYLRSLNRLASLLEIADESFKDIRNSLVNYRRQVKQVVKSGSFSDVEFNSESYKAYVLNGAFDSLNKQISTINNMEIEPGTILDLYVNFVELGFSTLKDFDDFVKKYSPAAYQLCVYQFSGMDIDIISDVAAPISVLTAYKLSVDASVEAITHFLDEIYGHRKSNERGANKLIEIGKKIGLVK